MSTLVAEKKSIRQFLQKQCKISPPVESDPRLLPASTKNIIILCVIMVTCTSGFSSTVYFPGLPLITDELNIQPIETILTASMFVLFMGIAPVIWASLSEFYHIRRFLFLVAMVIYMASSLCGVFVHSIGFLIFCRCAQSIGVSIGQSVGAGFIVDMYPIEERGRAFSKYMFGNIMGPLLGPIIGGLLITSPIRWRATFWFCFAFGAFLFLLTFFITPETFRNDALYDKQLASVDTHNNSCESSDSESTKETISTISDDNTFVTSIADDAVTVEVPVHESENEKIRQPLKKRFNPLTPFALLRHPFVLMSTLTLGVFFGSMFASESMLAPAFSEAYDLSTWQIGLSFAGGGIGNMLGAFTGSRLSDRLLLRSRRLRGGIAKSEDRLTMNVWIAGFIFSPLGSLLFGWVIEKRLSYWGAIVAFGIQCFGNVQVMISVTAYLVDSLPGLGASAAAVAIFGRCTCACIFSLICTPMVEKVGTGWASTLFACLSWLAMLLTLALKIRGEPIRRWSGY